MRFSPKKLLLMTGLTAMAISFAACGKKDAAKSSDGSAAAESTTAADANLPKEPKNFGKVTLGKYEGVEIKTHDVSVSDEEVDSYIQNVLENSQNLTEVDRPAASGDTVNIDYEGKKDGVAFDGGTAKGQNLELGSHSFIDGFEDGLIGAAKGEKRTLNLTFPADYGNKDLAGQAVTFDVTVNSVQEKSKPELNDEAYKALEDSYGYSKDMLVSILGKEQVDLQARELQVANFILDKATKVPAGADDTQAASAGESAGETAASEAAGETQASETAAETQASEGSVAAESTTQP